MTFPNNNLNQTCVYWGSPTPNGYGGFTYADPAELDCRWIEKTRVVDKGDGTQITSKAEVQINQDVNEEGLMYLGTLNDLDSSEEADPSTVNNAYKIKVFHKIPTMKGTSYFRKVYLG